MRKHLLFLIYLLFGSLTVIAQQGSTLLYGNFYFQRANNTVFGADAPWAWSLSPGIGYRFARKWTAGVNVAYGQSKNGSKIITIGGGPFVRYTGALSNRFSIFAQLEGGYAVYDYKDNANYSTTRIAVFPAIEMNLRHGFAINFGIGGIDYTSSRWGDRTDNYYRLNISLLSAATIGVSKRFGGKQQQKVIQAKNRHG